MKILAIETSCDETGVALVEAEGGLTGPRFKILENFIASQIETHRPWGGVVPNLAKREHDKNLPILTSNVFNKLSGQKIKIDRLAVTVGPGLDPCLWTGITFAEKLFERSSDHGLEITEPEPIGVNHLEGHLYSFLLAEKEIGDVKKVFPAVQLVVSGGHTILVLMTSLSDWKIIGETQDDAAGEAFDKVARMLGLPYPGGPEISLLAGEGNEKAVHFPRPMMASDNYNLSFSGLKTAVLYFLKENAQREKEEKSSVFKMNRKMKADIAASFQEAVVDVLTKKTIRAAEEFGARSIMLSGGVAANDALRERLSITSRKLSIDFISADKKFQTDNAVIIAVASYINYLTDKFYKLESRPDLGL